MAQKTDRQRIFRKTSQGTLSVHRNENCPNQLDTIIVKKCTNTKNTMKTLNANNNKMKI